ncbi:HAD-IIIC family phosphatase [Sphingomonas sp. Tas61C01]|uniref:HAD-IIIC family phosphatase n=1 Tax=Sphingomonas sp. Tas61C01 TaxID=3458297 RepID=UPI00403EB665
MVDSSRDRAAAGASLRAQRAEIAASLAALVGGWPKYATSYAADPAGFAATEYHALVDYLARAVEGDDETYLSLYIGEKAKQFHDPASPAEARKAREAELLAGERGVFLRSVDDAARPFVDAAFDRVDNALTGEAVAEVKALFVGDCLFLDVISFLTAPALADGIRIVPTFVTSHDARDIKAQVSALADERFDVVFFSPFTYAFLGSYEALHRPRVLRNPADAFATVDRAVAEGVDTFDVIADLFDCPIVAHLPAPLLRSEGTLRERMAAASTAPLRHRATRRLAAAIKSRAEQRNERGQVIYTLDEHAVIGKHGMAEAGRFLFRSDLQHPAVFGALLASSYRDIVMVVGRLLKRKLIASDLDNTLWSGVIGEGLGVTHHRDRHDALARLKARGIVLTINSKNDPVKAKWAPEAGLLDFDDFVSRQINWDPKPLNMRRIAEHLNLKVKDFVFIDDRADERAQVAEELPTVLSLDALDARTWRLMSLWADLLPAKAGADRTDFYRQRDSRQAFIASEVEADASEREATLTKLGLTLTIREAAPADVDRATDLINRTNQFNMTGARVTKREIAALAEGDDSWVLIADAADRFGAMGTISVLVLKRGPDGLGVLYFVLSCRVFGYGMEFALLEHARRLTGAGEALSGLLVKTDFNQPCQGVYAEAGFDQHDDRWVLPRAIEREIAVKPWLTVHGPAPSELSMAD